MKNPPLLKKQHNILQSHRNAATRSESKTGIIKSFWEGVKSPQGKPDGNLQHMYSLLFDVFEDILYWRDWNRLLLLKTQRIRGSSKNFPPHSR